MYMANDLVLFVELLTERFEVILVIQFGEFKYGMHDLVQLKDKITFVIELHSG